MRGPWLSDTGSGQDGNCPHCLKWVKIEPAGGETQEWSPDFPPVDWATCGECSGTIFSRMEDGTLFWYTPERLADQQSVEISSGGEPSIEPGILMLVCAAMVGDERRVGEMLERGISPDARAAGGCTALQMAVGRGHEPVVRLLVERGADVNAPDDSGITPIHLANETGRRRISEFLRAHGAVE